MKESKEFLVSGENPHLPNHKQGKEDEGCLKKKRN